MVKNTQNTQPCVTQPCVFCEFSLSLHRFSTIEFAIIIWVRQNITKVSCSEFRCLTIISSEERMICAAVDNHSSYVQQLSWLIFSLIDEGESVEERHLAMGVDSLLNSQEQLFMQQIEPLTAYQMNFLRYIIDGYHDNFGETEIRETFNLGSVSNITRLKTALVEKDLVEIHQSVTQEETNPYCPTGTYYHGISWRSVIALFLCPNDTLFLCHNDALFLCSDDILIY